MIRPPGFAGAAFGTSATGDLRVDAERRRRVAAELGIQPDWAFLDQVHGTDVVLATSAGDLGEGDALITQDPQIPVAVATADCVPLVVVGEGAVAVIHAGWRGALAGVVPATLRAMEAGDEGLLAVVDGGRHRTLLLRGRRGCRCAFSRVHWVDNVGHCECRCTRLCQKPAIGPRGLDVGRVHVHF